MTRFASSSHWVFALFCFVLGASTARAERPAEPQSALAIPFEAAEVSSPDGRVFTISWRAPGVGHVRIYAGADPQHIGREHLVAGRSGQGQVTISTLPAAARWYFLLTPDKGQPLVVADRSLHLSTAGNFRDVGGYRTVTGQWVRMGVAYRSNGLERLTPAELSVIAGLHLKLINDLRTDEERTRGPDRVPDGVNDLPADVLADDADKIHAMMSKPPTAASPEQRSEVMRSLYRDFVSLKSAQTAYHLLFTRLADADEAPSAFHCTAGKDRTGWADAVLLTILGVPRATIVSDYELTNDYLQGAAWAGVRRQFAGGPAAKPSADPADLEAAFDEVIRRYGSFDNYLHQGLGLDDKALTSIRRTFLVG